MIEIKLRVSDQLAARLMSLIDVDNPEADLEVMLDAMAERTGQTMTRPLVDFGPLEDLLVGMFSAQEVARALGGFVPEGSLPLRASLLEIAAQAVRTLHRQGQLQNRQLWVRLAAERPRRRDEVALVASQYGVTL